MRFSASAPGKAILFGEHYVVYGSPALSIPIEPRNRVAFSESSRPGAHLHSSLGGGRISEGGIFSGKKELSVFSAVAREAMRARGKSARIPACAVQFLPSWGLKGVGVSASLSAAFSAGLLKLSRQRQSSGKIFSCAQSGDMVAHGGRASGVDAKTVSVGAPIVFRKSFSPLRFTFSKSSFSLPSGSSLIIIDTFTGRKDGTERMLSNFARSFSIGGAPQEASEEKRAEVRAEFLPLWHGIRKAKGGAMLGRLMDENHALLFARGVSGKSIEKAIVSAKAYGAYGAKLTGGGGEGGAVLALFSKADAAKSARKITCSTGFQCYPVSIARKGACID